VSLTSAGNVVAGDANGTLGIIGQYTANTDHQLEALFHMDAGTYDIELDASPLVSGRSHGITTRGVGALLVGPDHTATPGNLLYVDNIRVTAPSIGIFRDSFEKQPIRFLSVLATQTAASPISVQLHLCRPRRGVGRKIIAPYRI
jgi:hypothetical protein